MVFIVYLAKDHAKAIAQPIKVQPRKRLIMNIEVVLGWDLDIAIAVGNK
jgi:hypothetical protein